jgi:D-amino-acid oxidase
MADVVVVGGGVVGLTTALRLAEAGHRVRCVRDVPALDTVSALSGGLWFPYHVEPRDRVAGWGLTALARFTALANDPESGVAVREGVMVERGPADRWWLDGVSGWRDAAPDELPPGATAGVVARLPVVTMPVHLLWLEDRCRQAGAELAEDHVDDLADVAADVVVVAAGLRSAALVPGLEITPSRGQVALLANPGVEHWVVDDANPAGMTYVLPHPGWVVCGGTDSAGLVDDRPDPDVHEAIVARCRDAVPALREAEVLGSRVGFRPVAPSVSLEVLEVGGRVVVTNAGHGGAGVTVSWGCADEVVALVSAVG